jgi:hypothetical protein
LDAGRQDNSVYSVEFVSGLGRYDALPDGIVKYHLSLLPRDAAMKVKALNERFRAAMLRGQTDEQCDTWNAEFRKANTLPLQMELNAIGNKYKDREHRELDTIDRSYTVGSIIERSEVKRLEREEDMRRKGIIPNGSSQKRERKKVLNR